MGILKFRPQNVNKAEQVNKAKQANKANKVKQVKQERGCPSGPPGVEGPPGLTAVDYCFNLVNSAMKQDDKVAVAKNLLAWFIVNSESKTLDKFIVWIVKNKEDK